MSMWRTVQVHGYQTLECSLPETGQAGTEAGSSGMSTTSHTQEHHRRPSPGRRRRNMQENQE